LTDLHEITPRAKLQRVKQTTLDVVDAAAGHEAVFGFRTDLPAGYRSSGGQRHCRPVKRRIATDHGAMWNVPRSFLLRAPPQAEMLRTIAQAAENFSGVARDDGRLAASH
jgi:hypothetical protein